MCLVFNCPTFWGQYTIDYYNSRRISLKLKGLSPIEYRTQTYVPRV
ncbi:IS3 family transposase [Klebsiella michiganensis]